MTSTTTTPTACPVPWCDQHANGHEFPSEWPDGRLSRTHAADVGHLSIAPGPNSEVWVDVSAEETVSEDGCSIERPHVALYASHIELTADEARQVAGWLQQAAQRLDVILGGQ